MILFLFYIFHGHLKLRIRFSRKCYIWIYNLCALYSRSAFCAQVGAEGGPLWAPRFSWSRGAVQRSRGPRPTLALW